MAYGAQTLKTFLTLVATWGEASGPHDTLDLVVVFLGILLKLKKWEEPNLGQTGRGI